MMTGCRRIGSTLAIGALVAAVWAPAALASVLPQGRLEDRTKVCMLDNVVHDEPGVEFAYQGQRYFLCCPRCRDRFSADPEAFGRDLDPVSREPVEKARAAIYAYGGRAYFFASDEHLQTFAQEPERYLASEAHPGHVPATGAGCQAESSQGSCQ
jgi:YHS domain-containing protein